MYTENQWNAIPSSEIFSRYSGTCVILGDRTRPSVQNIPHKIKLGDCFRLGSVGVVVSEIRTKFNGDEQKLDSKTIQFLKDEALTLKDDLDDEELLATFAKDENHITKRLSQDFSNLTNTIRSSKSANIEHRHSKHDGILNGEKFVCYMCYENTDTPENPLVAPCECRGDTRYLHVKCLQKWYSASIGNQFSQVIRTTGNGAPACKICGTAYKTAFKRLGTFIHMIFFII